MRERNDPRPLSFFYSIVIIGIFELSCERSRRAQSIRKASEARTQSAYATAETLRSKICVSKSALRNDPALGKDGTTESADTKKTNRTTVDFFWS